MPKHPNEQYPDTQQLNTVRLEVRTKAGNNFRRAGHSFGPNPIEDSFEEDVANMLRNEPQLLVRELGAGGKALKPGQIPDDADPSKHESAPVATPEAAQAAKLAQRGNVPAMPPPVEPIKSDKK